MRGRAIVAAGLCALSGCAGTGHYLKSGYVPPRRIAVLPFNNHTTDLDGPGVVRYWVDRRLSEKKSYATVEIARADAQLKELGINDGGQLPGLTPQRLGQALGADALLYGDLLQFGASTTGFLNVRRVQARLRLVDARTGERLWEAEGAGGSSETAVTPSGALRAGLKAAGTLLAEKAMHSPLKTETLDMVWDAIQYLPPGK